jgi:hypothetical protein
LNRTGGFGAAAGSLNAIERLQSKALAEGEKVH